jgi:hypothetical protein
MQSIAVGPLAVHRLEESPTFEWFPTDGVDLDWWEGALRTKVFKGRAAIPPAWVGRARKQLAVKELQRRTTLSWDVPKADLEALLGQECEILRSQPTYLKGTGCQLKLEGKLQQDGSSMIGVFLMPCKYEQHSVVLAPASPALTCRMEIKHQLPDSAKPETMLSTTATVSSNGWGLAEVIIATTPADLEPYLVDGCLKLRATVNLI